MDERNLDFKAGDLVEWTELCGEGFIVNQRGLGIIVDKCKRFFKVQRLTQQDIVNFDVYQLKLINKK